MIALRFLKKHLKTNALIGERWVPVLLLVWERKLPIRFTRSLAGGGDFFNLLSPVFVTTAATAAAVVVAAARTKETWSVFQLTFKGRKPYNIPLLPVLVGEDWRLAMQDCGRELGARRRKKRREKGKKKQNKRWERERERESTLCMYKHSTQQGPHDSSKRGYRTSLDPESLSYPLSLFLFR